MADIYRDAKRIGDREVRAAAARGEYPYVPALDHFLEQLGPLPQVPVGLMEIPLSKVAGTKTVDRSNAFSRNFMPVLGAETELAFKWRCLYTAQLEEGIRDPVKAYEYMWRFYVQEGNKRVSVLKYLEVPEILADVTRLMPSMSEDPKVHAYYEFTEFYKAAPIYDIEFSEPGSYHALAAHVGRDLKMPWPEETVYTVRNAFRTFEELFLKKGGGDIGLSASDAFSVYIRIFRLDSLVNEPEEVLKRRIDGVWKEMVALSPEMETYVGYRPAGDSDTGEIGPLGTLKSFLHRMPEYTSEHPLKAAFIQEKNTEISNWTYAHDEGRRYLDEAFEGIVETRGFENCDTDEDIRAAVEACVSDGVQVIFTTSPSQMPETLRQAVRHPDIHFLNASVNLPSKTVRTYSGRVFEAKFLMGAAAAFQAPNHRIGYIENSPLYGTIAGINAFAVGAAMIDPDARIFLGWKAQKDADWQAWMHEQGITVFSGPDRINPERSSREYGIYRYDASGRAVNIASPVVNWGLYYKMILRTILNGSWNAMSSEKTGQPVSYWWGMSSGIIDVKLMEELPYQSKKLIGILKKGLVEETLSPFEGELRSQEGIVREEGSPRLTYEEIISMDWLADNVVGKIPRPDELREDAKKAVWIGGLKE